MTVSKKVDALDAEANKKDVEFEFEGIKFVVPHPKRWPLKVERARENGKLLLAIETLLGSQYKKFDPDEERTNEDLDGLVEAMFAAIDLDPKA